MSDFQRAFGHPDPAAPDGLRFTRAWERGVWDDLRAQTGTGWFLDRFLYLFGEGLDALAPCLEAWSFLVPQQVEKMIVGRNAYGALLVLENPNQFGPQSRVGILDPVSVVYRKHPDLDFAGLVGYWLPQRQLPEFLDRAVYDEWRRRSGRHLEPDHILGARQPLGLGGSMTLGNFQEEEIVQYYRTTAPIYRKALDPGGPRKPPSRKRKPK